MDFASLGDEKSLSSGLRLSLDGWVNLCVPALHHCPTKQFSAGHLASVFSLGSFGMSFSLFAEGRRSEGQPWAGVLSKRGALPRRLMIFHLVWTSRRILHVVLFPGKWLLGLYPLHLKESECFFPCWLFVLAHTCSLVQWSWPVLKPIEIMFSFPSCVIIWQRWWCIFLAFVCKHCSYKNSTCYNRAAAETCCCFDDLPCKYIIWAAASSNESH